MAVLDRFVVRPRRVDFSGLPNAARGNGYLPTAPGDGRSTAGGDHLDLVGDSAHARDSRRDFERGVAVGLLPDLTLQGQPARVDADVDAFLGNVGI